MKRAALSAVAALALSGLVVSHDGAAQARAGRAAAAAPDSAAAVIANLRAAEKAHPDSFELVLALGRLIGRHTDEQSNHWEERFEARNLLDHAVRLRPDDPRARLEFGMLQRKQHEQIDGMRSLKKAEELANHNDSMFSAADRADMHEHMALIYEVWWEDWANLYFVPDFMLHGSLVCGDNRYNGLIAINFRCHSKFVEAVGHFHLMEDLKEDDRAAMVHHFAAAVEADPTRVWPMLHLLRWLADWGKWDDYLTHADAFVKARPNDPEVLLFQGLGLHEVGRSKEADSVLNRVLALASGDLKATLLDITPVIQRSLQQPFGALPEQDQNAIGQQYWNAWDPLYITPENERLAEHFARVAYADLAFTSPTSGKPGRTSDRGQLWIGFGRPNKVRSIIANDGGRNEFWDYGDSIPNVVFQRQLTYRTAWSLGNDVDAPAMIEPYRPTHPRMVGKVPFQATRFRGADGKTELNVYGAIPLDSMGQTDSIKTGLFVFTLRPWQGVTAGRATVPALLATRPAHFVAPLLPGTYAVSVEALGNDRAATGRDTVVIAPRGTGMELSDILFANNVTPRITTPRSRDELAIEGSATLNFHPTSPVGVVWEIYGLKPDTGGTARYHVQLEVRDARGGVIRALRTLTLQGNARETTLTWDADRALGPTGAALEYTTLALQDARPGPYKLLITVTDRLSGTHATAERQFTVVP